MSASNIRIPLQSLRVHRDGVNVTPELGQPFKFTADELKAIKEQEDHSGVSLVRTAVNETESSEDAAQKQVDAAKRRAAAEKLNSLIEAAKLAEEKFNADKTDAKLQKAYDAAKADVRKQCVAAGVDVPEAFKEEAL